MEIDARQRELRRQGFPIISFGAGEPDFPTPAPIAGAGLDAIRDGRTKYTAVNGIPELREAVSARLLDDHGLSYAPDQITITTGAKAALFNAFQALLSPGDEVIIPAPYWVSYEAQVLLAGGVPVIVPTVEADGFKLDAGTLQRHLTAKTRLLVLNSPCNPTGSVYSRDELRALGDVLLPSGAGVVSDEIYQRISYDRPAPSFAASVPEMMDRTILINGASKSYSMTGWRIGYAAGPLEVVQAMNTVQSHSTSNATSISQYAAVEAFRGPQDEVVSMCSAFKARRDVMVSLLRQIPGVTCALPAGAFYAFPSVEALVDARRHASLPHSSAGLATHLLEQAHVATVPGEAFGAPGYLRLSYACSMAEIQEGVSRIRETVAAAAV
jgi:aspartate aminotransferase